MIELGPRKPSTVLPFATLSPFLITPTYDSAPVSTFVEKMVIVDSSATTYTCFPSGLSDLTENSPSDAVGSAGALIVKRSYQARGVHRGATRRVTANARTGQSDGRGSRYFRSIHEAAYGARLAGPGRSYSSY
eukprot:scaffold1552_cov165-Pinguiococcus_pyrenoidosus.AAC.5